jgi:GH24 family phage-related lysozyme (muramidase)
MSAIQPTDNTGLIVDEFISYATSHLNSVEGVIYTVSLYPPIGTPNVGVLKWKGYSVSPATRTVIVTQDDFKPKEAVDEHNSVRPTNEESIQNGTTEQQIDEDLSFLLDDSDSFTQDSGETVKGFKWNQGKPFVQGFRGGGSGFSSGFSGAVNVDLGALDLSADWITLASKFIGKNEGFTDKATWDVNAYRCGFGTSKIIGSDGKIRDVQPSPDYYKQTGEKQPANGDRTTVESALKLLGYEVSTTFKKRLVGSEAYQIPEATFNALNDRQKAALISYVYNVGSLRVGIATALKAGNLSSAAAQIQAGPVTPEQYRVGLTRRRNEEATLFSS